MDKKYTRMSTASGQQYMSKSDKMHNASEGRVHGYKSSLSEISRPKNRTGWIAGCKTAGTDAK